MASYQWSFSSSMLCVFGSFLLIFTCSSSAAVLGPCRYTSYPGLCLSLTESLHHRKHAPTAAAVARVSIKTTIIRTFQAKKLALYHFRVNSGDPIVRANLKVCQEVYDDALDNLRKSISNIRTIHRYKRNQAAAIDTLKINLSAVITDYSTCDDAFAENPGEKSPLAMVNGMLNMLASNNLALACKIHS